MSLSRFDFVILGATGFTGKYVAQEVLNVSKHNGPLTWALAGRSEKKLKELKSTLETQNKVDLKDVPIIVADIKSNESLASMASRAKVVLNCCGPYRFLGEAVVKACVENGASHVDVSGEPQYMEKMQLKYDEDAKKAGVYVVSACGFDSIPADLGVCFLEQKFGGQVNSVETYLESKLVGEVAQKTAVIHYATWESAVYGLAHASELGPLRRKLYPERLPPLTPKLSPRGTIHKHPVIEKWSLPFPGSDRSVVQRSQRFLFESEKKRPVQVYTYCAFDSFSSMMLVTIVGAIFSFLAMFSFGRKLLLNFPGFFSCGAVSHEGPSEEVAAKTRFSVTIFGNGWSEALAEPFDKHVDKPDKQLAVVVSGMNPGYGATATCIVLAALTILRESDKMPGTGGVYSPGAAFVKTSLVENLNKAGVTFEVVADEMPKEKVSYSYVGGLFQHLISNNIY